MHRIISSRFDGFAPGSTYRALMICGLLVRTESACGLAVYAIKPDALSAWYDTLRCHWGTTGFIEGWCCVNT